jgi:hypothetical protein
MSKYHLHARLHEGPLGHPVRNEPQTRESDDLAEVEQLAKELATLGFTGWIYVHGNTAVSSGGSDYRTVLKYGPRWSAGRLPMTVLAFVRRTAEAVGGSELERPRVADGQRLGGAACLCYLAADTLERCFAEDR